MFSRPGVQTSYNHNVRIGNWSEDRELHEQRIKEYINKKNKGQLLIQHVDTHQKDALTEVGLTYSRDGYVHYGDHILIYSAATQGVLSCDPTDAATSGERGFAVTTSTLTKAHVARNTFILQPHNNNDNIGDIITYGSLFRIRVNNKLCNGEPYYLHSQPLGGGSSSKISRHQEVSMSANGTSFDTVWKCISKNINTRYQYDTTPIPINTELLFIHANTHQSLSSSPLRYLNDFGSEYEVCAHTHIHIGKTHTLIKEKVGERIAEEGSRQEHIDNIFSILTAANEERERLLVREEEKTGIIVKNTVESIRNELIKRGVDSLFAFSRSLHLLDNTHSDILPYALFISVLISHKLNLSGEEQNLLCNLFDYSNSGNVDYITFLKSIRGLNFTADRRKVVRRAFNILDTAGDDKILLPILLDKFNTTSDIGVREGWKTVEESKKEMELRFKPYADKSNGYVRWIPFEDFYETISCFVVEDKTFEILVNAAWRIPLE